MISVVLALQLILSPAAFAGWELIERDGKRFALVPEEEIMNIVLDLQKLDGLEEEKEGFTRFSDIQKEQIDSLQRTLRLQSTKEDMYRMREAIYIEQVNFLSENYENEIEENGRLRINRPSPLRWSLFGGVVTVGVIGFTAWILESIK